MNLDNKKVLIVKPSSMGDVIHAIPVAHAIKRVYPGSKIGWVIQSGLESLLLGDSAVDEIIRIDIPSTSNPGAPKRAYLDAAVATFRQLGQLRRKFKSSGYEIVIDLHASFRSGLISMTCPKSFRYGLEDAKELNTFFQSELIRLDSSKPHAVDKNLACLSIFGIESAPEDFLLRLPDDVTHEAGRFWGNIAPKDEKPVIYANPCARWITKMWNIHAWRRLTEMMIDELNATVLFGGGKGDANHINEILEGLSENTIKSARNIAGKLSPVVSAAVMSKCQAYIGVDSGPMHMAAFLGLPIVAIFGPTDPCKVGPYTKLSVVIRNTNLDCLSCRKSSCTNLRCMNEIGPETLFQALKTLL